MTAVGRAARTTLRTIGRDPGMLALLGVASVFYSLFYPTPYLHQVLRDVPVVVVDRDHTSMSRRFARWLDASEGVAVAGRSADLEAAQQAVRAGKLGGVVLIPTDFERHLLRREPATVTTYVDGSYLLVRSTLSQTVNTVAATFGAGITNRPAPLALASWPLFNPAGGYATFLVPAVFILVLQQTLLIGMGTLRVAERHSPIGDSGPVWARIGGIVTVLLVLYLLEAAVHVPGRVPAVRIAAQGRPAHRGRLPHPIHHGEHPAGPCDRRAVRPSRVIHRGARPHVRPSLVPLRHQLPVGKPGGVGPGHRAGASDHVRHPRLRPDRRDGRHAGGSVEIVGRALAPDPDLRTDRGLSHEP